MKIHLLFCLVFFLSLSSRSQNSVVVIGSSTAAGLATSSPDSSWVGRFNQYYKRTLGVVDSVYNLGVSGSNLYHGMPSAYTPPPGRPSPDINNNVSRAVSLLGGVPVPTNGIVIINYPSGGYDTYSIPEILSALQIMYDSATRLGNRAYVTTTQPRTDGAFNTPAVKRKLAVIKDSILNRFGVNNTINFWDGMFNPVDTTILPAYSAGDNVHFNNRGHRVLFDRVLAKNILNLTPLTYRSNVSPTGLWNDPASWQVLNGSVWITATIAPSSGSGPITILNGDSIRINSYTELDQLTIENGGVLTIFNTNTPAEKVTAALNNGTGDDIMNYGRLYISSNGILNGNGTVRNMNGGVFTMRNRGVLEANAINNGTLFINNTGIVRNRTVINNRICVLQDFTLNLINSTFVNNDSMAITGTGTTFIADSTLTGGIFRNSATGILYRLQTTGSTIFTSSVSVTNNGIIKGFGEFAIDNMPVNNGSIAPGNSPGIITINPLTVNAGKTPLFDIEISSTGNIAGINYDQLVFSSRNTTSKNITGARLRVTDNAADPVGTVYTIFSTGSGSITGPFASTTLSASLSGPFYNGTNITVIKTSVLPVSWGEFTAVSENNKTKLNWQTLQEFNSSHFIIEHSTDGRNYERIGSVTAAGESLSPMDYNFTHTNPLLSGTNFYRIRQVDKDGEESLSAIRTVRFADESSDFISISPNPFRNHLLVQVNMQQVKCTIYNTSGMPVYTAVLNKGAHQLVLNNLPAGNYVLVAWNNKQEKQSWTLVKQ